MRYMMGVILTYTSQIGFDWLHCSASPLGVFFFFCNPCVTYLLYFCSSVPHTRSLEARIKEELVAQGLLDSEERPGPGGDSEDEVQAELLKRQAELKALGAHNRARKQELLRWGQQSIHLPQSITPDQLLANTSDSLFPCRLAKEEMRKQELRQRVRVADNEVMEAFRRIMAARQKKRTPTKKEKDQAWKALKERESILKLLDG